MPPLPAAPIGNYRKRRGLRVGVITAVNEVADALAGRTGIAWYAPDVTDLVGMTLVERVGDVS